MNRIVKNILLSYTNNKKLYQITQYKKINRDDYLLPCVITFKKFYVDYFQIICKNGKGIPFISKESVVWYDHFLVYDFNYINEIIFKTALQNGNLKFLNWLKQNRNSIFKYYIKNIQLDNPMMDLKIEK